MIRAKKGLTEVVEGLVKSSATVRRLLYDERVGLELVEDRWKVSVDGTVVGWANTYEDAWHLVNKTLG